MGEARYDTFQALAKRALSEPVNEVLADVCIELSFEDEPARPSSTRALHEIIDRVRAEASAGPQEHTEEAVIRIVKSRVEVLARVAELETELVSERHNHAETAALANEERRARIAAEKDRNDWRKVATAMTAELP